MGNSRLSLPKQKNYEYGYKLAYELAGEHFAKVAIDEQCRKSGARYRVADSGKIITVEYLNQSYQIKFPDIEISLVDSEAKVPVKDKILILHYLTLAKGTPTANKFIAFKDLPEGANYFPTFSKRSIEPLVSYFGRESHRLIDVASRLGGRRVDYGDVAVAIGAFPRVPVTLVLWQGDDEFPPRGNIIFDITISDYLYTYDIILICETITWKLVKFLTEGSVKSVGS
jgi:hypothetical protein